MKHLILMTCAALLFGAGMAAAQDSAPDKATAQQMGYRTLSNGSVVYEEIPGVDNDISSPENISPAAGDDTAQDAASPNAAPEFHYDPLTQTYRRTTVDRNGNSRQDIINTNDQ